MWRHLDNGDSKVSLHDCRATKVSFKNGNLSFLFTDGIFLVKDKKVLKTGSARVKFYLENRDEDDITIQVFKKKLNKIIREEWTLKKLIKGINKGKYELEFLYRYQGYNSMIFECWLWFDKKPYHMECTLKMYIDKLEYYWSDILA